jgi:hypothetical protein
VTPAGGIVSSGTPIRIDGTGFDQGTAVSIDGVSVSRTEFVSPQQVNVILNAPTELTGKHFRVANSAGEYVDYFPAFPSAPSDPPAGLTNNAPGVHPLVPLASSTSASSPSTSSPSTRSSGMDVQIALLNPNPAPVDVAFVGGPPRDAPIGASLLQAITIPAGVSYFLETSSFGLNYNTLYAIASAPLRMLEYEVPSAHPPFPPFYEGTLVDLPTPVASPPAVQAFDSFLSVSWSWQAGSPLPPAQQFQISAGFAASVSPDLAEWLSVTPMQSATPATLSLALVPGASLSPGTYNGTVTITPVLNGPAASVPVITSTIGVSATVSAGPLLVTSASSPITNFLLAAGGSAATNTVPLFTNGQPAAFTLSTSTNSGGNWLSVTPSSGTTPATLSVTANPAGLAAGVYSGAITVQGPGNTLSIVVELMVTSPAPPPSTGPLYVIPESLALTLESGEQAPVQYMGWQPNVPVTVSVATQSGGNWLSAAYQPGGVLYGGGTISISAVGLAPGTYQGTITVASTSDGTAQVPVTLTVVAAPGLQVQLNVTPSKVSLSDQDRIETLTVSSDGTPAPFTVQTSTPGGDLWLATGVQANYELPDAQGKALTPGTVTVTAFAQEPGTHAGSIVITGPNGSVTVPVTLTTAGTSAGGPPWPPVMAAVVGGAARPGAISPGEIATILGMGFGPTLSGTQVLIDNVSATLLHVDGNVIELMVPHDIPTGQFATVQVIANGQQAADWGVPMAPAAPRILRRGERGPGEITVLHMDNSANGPANPALGDTAIRVFATGEDQTSPPASPAR